MFKKLLIITMVTSLMVLSFASCKNDAAKSSSTNALLTSSATKANGTSIKATAANTSSQKPVSSATATPSTAISTVNLAIGKTSLASSIYETAAWPASMANDGDYTTRWSSFDTAHSTGIEWYQVDLASTFTIDNVNIYWEVACATSYQIQVSNDAINWTTIYTTTEGVGGTD